MFGAAYLKTRTLWFPFALHFAWNWVQGAFLGITVSGLKQLITAPLFRATDAGPVWLTGGEYGIEGLPALQQHARGGIAGILGALGIDLQCRVHRRPCFTQRLDTPDKREVARQCLIDEWEYDDPHPQPRELGQLRQDIVVRDPRGPLVDRVVRRRSNDHRVMAWRPRYGHQQPGRRLQLLCAGQYAGGDERHP